MQIQLKSLAILVEEEIYLYIGPILEFNVDYKDVHFVNQFATNIIA